MSRGVNILNRLVNEWSFGTSRNLSVTAPSWRNLSFAIGSLLIWVNPSSAAACVKAFAQPTFLRLIPVCPFGFTAPSRLLSLPGASSIAEFSSLGPEPVPGPDGAQEIEIEIGKARATWDQASDLVVTQHP